MEINSKKLLFLGLILVIVFAAGCVRQKPSLQDRFGSGLDDDSNVADSNAGNQNPGNNNTQPLDLREQINACRALPNEGQADTCLKALAVEKKSADPCERLTLLPKNICYDEVATASENDVYCEKILEQDLRDSCFKKVGLVTGDSDTCGKIGGNQDYRNECYKYSAEKNTNQETCALVLDSAVRDACYLKVADLLNDNSFCDKVSTRLTTDGYNRDLCILAAPNVTGDQCAQMLGEVDRAACFLRATNIPNLEVNCDIFSDSNSVTNCKNWFVKYSGDVSPCYELGATEIETCITGAVDGNVTLTMCQTITGSYLDARNTCYKKLALQTNDKSYCENVSGNLQIRLACQTDVAVAKLDKTLCPTRTDARDDCIAKIALATKNFSMCESISTDRSYINCFTDIAFDLDSSEICGRSKRTNMRLLPYTGADYCYNDYAIAVKDAGVCKKIGFSFLRNDCLEIIETCFDNDNVCDEAVCSYSNDTDCLKPGQCNVVSECVDGRYSTTDTCVNNICKNTLITSCTGSDRYCPSNCTYVGNPAADNNTDSDCEKPCTLAGGEICEEGTVCPDSHAVNSLDAQCCELHEDPEQTYCEAS